MQQNDYKFRTTSKKDFIADMGKLGLEVECVKPEDLESGYFQSNNFSVVWLGKLANPYEVDEEGSPIGEVTYIDGEFVDVRSTEELPEGFEDFFENTVLDDRYPHKFS